MKTFIVILACFAIGFMAVLAWLTHSTYETGHRMALLQVTAALKEGMRDQRTFEIRGISNIEFRPTKSHDALVVAGAGDQGIRRVAP